MKNIAILGASDKPERYSFKAMKMLLQHGYNPLLVTPSKEEIEGIKTFKTLSDIDGPIDAITVYVNPEISTNLVNSIIQCNPKAVIFNPGSENPEVYNAFKEAKIKFEEACTLVLLSSDQFESIF